MNKFDEVKTAFQNNDLDSLKKIIQQLYIELTSYSTPESIDFIIQKKDVNKLKSILNSDSYIKCINFIPIYSLVKDKIDIIRERGGILTLEQMKEEIFDKIDKNEKVYDRILLERLINGIDYIMNEWKLNEYQDLVEDIDKDLTNEIIELLKLKKGILSKGLYRELRDFLGEIKGSDFTSWKENKYDSETTKKMDYQALDCILDSKEEEFIKPLFDKNRNTFVLFQIEAKEQNLIKLMLKQIKENKMEPKLFNFFKNEQKILLKQVDDPFDIDMNSIQEKSCKIILKKWKENQLEADIYTSLTNLSILVYDKDPSSEIERESALMLIGQVKKDEISKEFSDTLIDHLKDYFIGLETTDDQYKRTTLLILNSFKNKTFKNRDEFFNQIFKKWIKRREFLLDLLDPRLKLLEFYKLKQE